MAGGGFLAFSSLYSSSIFHLIRFVAEKDGMENRSPKNKEKKRKERKQKEKEKRKQDKKIKIEDRISLLLFVSCFSICLFPFPSLFLFILLSTEDHYQPTTAAAEEENRIGRCLLVNVFLFTKGCRSSFTSSLPCAVRYSATLPFG